MIGARSKPLFCRDAVRLTNQTIATLLANGDAAEWSNRLALRMKTFRHAFGSRIGLRHDLRHEIDVRETSKPQGADGKEPLRRTPIDLECTRCIDRETKAELVRHRKAGVDKAAQQRRIQIGRLASTIDHVIGIELLGLLPSRGPQNQPCWRPPDEVTAPQQRVTLSHLLIEANMQGFGQPIAMAVIERPQMTVELLLLTGRQGSP